MRISIGFFLFLVSISFSTLSQTLLLKNGDTVKGSSINCKKETVAITVDGNELYYRRHEVEGFFDNAGPMLYLKLIPDVDPEKFEYAFFERILDGEISVYKWVSQYLTSSVPVAAVGMGTKTVSTSLSLFAEKGDLYGWLVQNQGAEPLIMLEYTDNEEKALLKSMIMDRPEFVDRIRSDKFKYKYDHIVELLTEYNVAKFQKSAGKITTLSPVLLYRVPKKKYFPIQITVDDSAKYDMPVKRALAVPLQPNTLHKLCITYDTLKTCLPFRRIPYFMQYFAIDHKEGQYKLKLEPSDEKNATFYINKSLTYP